MSMMKKNRFETRNAKIEKKANFDGLGLEPWGEVEETNPDDFLIPWGTEEDHERANQALMNHFASRR